MFPIALGIGAGLSALGSIFGGISANKRMKEADRMLADRQHKLDAWYNSEMNQPYLDRADSRAMLKRIRDYNADEMKALNTSAVKSGATDEAKVAAANQLNRNYSQVVAQIAGLGEQHKNQVRRDYMSRLDNLDSIRYQSQVGKAEGIQNMIGGLGSSLGQLALLYGLSSGKNSGLAGIAGK